MMAYDSENIFAKILRGDIPNHTILETDDVLAFMDVMPQADGHALVIPKNPSRNVLDANPLVFGSLFSAVQRVANAAKTAFQADGVLVQQFNETAAGQTVFHLHVHVIPRHAGMPLGAHSGQMANNELLAAHAQKYRDVLS